MLSVPPSRQGWLYRLISVCVCEASVMFYPPNNLRCVGCSKTHTKKKMGLFMAISMELLGKFYLPNVCGILGYEKKSYFVENAYRKKDNSS